ncbi:hypothetical protein [Actinocorallia sp. A-T 12471]|uniref:hypothetical protein n=1 Tax=Actinocorallia sp. A-T 12471 TaxID=3089813 RepID=UPI0029CD2C24|nr:hypothetical protein [Actinocorallia sp. A-T 12471]MDX6740247.1 hypothetical protein [Actinocorallia sp. A-T 12471]
MTDSEVSEVAAYEINGLVKRVIAGRRSQSLHVESVLREVSVAVDDFQTALRKHGLRRVLENEGRSVAAQVLDEITQNHRFDCLYCEEFDPLALLDIAVTTFTDRLDGAVDPDSAPRPVLAQCSTEAAYVTLPRGHDATDEPLVLILGKPDNTVIAAVMSSGSGYGTQPPGPWTWYLSRTVPDGCVTGIGDIRIHTPAPSARTAAEVGTLLARVHRGEIPVNL